MAGGDGRDELHAAATGSEVGGDPIGGFGLDLRLTARKPPVLHDGDGWIDFGPAGGSYYYSRTDMAATGTVTLGDETLAVEGDALVRPPVGRLHLGRRRRLGLVRGQPRRRHGPHAVARPRGRRDLPARLRHARRCGRARRRTSTPTRSRSTSPTTGRARRRARPTPPAGGCGSRRSSLEIGLRPTVAQQELDTRATTGVVYWEGSQTVTATRDGRPLGGQAYVELTGYANP